MAVLLNLKLSNAGLMDAEMFEDFASAVCLWLIETINWCVVITLDFTLFVGGASEWNSFCTGFSFHDLQPNIRALWASNK